MDTSNAAASNEEMRAAQDAYRHAARLIDAGTPPEVVSRLLHETAEQIEALLAAAGHAAEPTKPGTAMETAGPYLAMLCRGIPADACDYGVISLSAGVEVARIWKREDARAIADLLNSSHMPADGDTPG